MSPSVVNLYAEFLLNISQVTIFATLDLRGKDIDTAHFYSDRKRIEVTYAGDKAAITFPNGISGTAVVHLPVKAAAHVSLRLEITEKGDPYWKNSLETLNASPWSAHAFSEQTTLACAGCKKVICEAGQVRAWKDLPRGDWAETMDLWHCHKPTEGGHDHSTEKAKAFEDAASPAPRTGTAFIDSSNLILCTDNVKHSKVRLCPCYMLRAARKFHVWTYPTSGMKLIPMPKNYSLLICGFSSLPSLLSFQLRVHPIRTTGIKKVHADGVLAHDR